MDPNSNENKAVETEPRDAAASDTPPETRTEKTEAVGAATHSDGHTTVKRVAEVALAEATAQQKPSPWTSNMFLVRALACISPALVCRYIDLSSSMGAWQLLL